VAYKDPDRQRAYQRDHQRRWRLIRKERVIKLLGGGCKRCGFDNPDALELDHIIPVNRKTNGLGDAGSELWRKVANGYIPLSDVQLLCCNCHAIKTAEDRHFNNHRRV
jgi:5-methylcytosine-specific restriction endonuclease McrA